MNYVFMSSFSIVWLVALIITLGFVFRWIMHIYESDDRKRERYENREDAIANVRLQQSIHRTSLETIDYALHIADKYRISPELVLNNLSPNQAAVGYQNHNPHAINVQSTGTRELTVRR